MQPFVAGATKGCGRGFMTGEQVRKGQAVSHDPRGNQREVARLFSSRCQSHLTSDAWSKNQRDFPRTSPGCATLSPSYGERDGVRGMFPGSWPHCAFKFWKSRLSMNRHGWVCNLLLQVQQKVASAGSWPQGALGGAGRLSQLRRRATVRADGHGTLSSCRRLSLTLWWMGPALGIDGPRRGAQPASMNGSKSIAKELGVLFLIAGVGVTACALLDSWVFPGAGVYRLDKLGYTIRKERIPVGMVELLANPKKYHGAFM